MTIENTTYTKSGRTFKLKEIKQIQEISRDKYHTSRCEISRSVCMNLNWYSENGKPKAWVCRELLLQLERDGLINLPQPQIRSFNRFKKKKDTAEFKEPGFMFEGKLNSFPIPVFHRVNSSDDNTLWEYLVDRYHYLGYKGVMGRFLKYIVYLEDTPVACLGWTGAALNVSARDKWIGWSAEIRKEKLKHVINNFRFVIFPWAKIKFLASHLLSKNIYLLRKDWKEQYNIQVYLLETFIDKGRFTGISYKASNWVKVGETKGYAKRKKGYVKHGLIKDVYLYPVELERLL